MTRRLLALLTVGCLLLGFAQPVAATQPTCPAGWNLHFD